MIIRINGQEEILTTPATLGDLIAIKRFSPDSIVVEHNERIVPKTEWPSLALAENDRLEIVSFVGGG